MPVKRDQALYGDGPVRSDDNARRKSTMVTFRIKHIEMLQRIEIGHHRENMRELE